MSDRRRQESNLAAALTNEEILDWCFKNGKKPSAEEILVWNQFLMKRGWRDESSDDLESFKKELGFGSRPDIQTWVDLQEVDEGRPLK